MVFAFLIEIVSAFGPAGVVAYAEATRRASDVTSTTQPDTARSGELLPAAASDGEHGRVVKWMADRTEPTGDTSAIPLDDLHADYEVWCIAKNMNAAKCDAFGEEFDRVREVPELAGKIRKFGNRYYGIRLVASNIAQLQPRKKLK